jgi:hypothetical protein
VSAATQYNYLERKMGGYMTRRLCSLLALILLLTTSALTKQKKPRISDYILHAETVIVAIEPDTGEPLDNPNANKQARENVERALTQWGRFRIIPDGQQSDLVVGIRIGNDKLVRPTIKADDNIRIGQIGQRSQGPPLGGEPRPDPDSRNPRITNEVGPTADSFSVYRGGRANGFSSSALWHYTAKECLRAPEIKAVEEFRKAVADAEKAKTPNTP